MARLANVVRLLYGIGAAKFELVERGFMKQRGSTLRERSVVVLLGWLGALFYIFTFVDFVRGMRRPVSGDLAQADIVLHSCVPILSLAVWLGMTMLAIVACVMLIVGAYEYVGGFAWIVLFSIPVLAGLSALVPAKPGWTDIHSIYSSLYYILEAAVAVVLVMVVRAAQRVEKTY